jgi:hypothetical protein
MSGLSLAAAMTSLRSTSCSACSFPSTALDASGPQSPPSAVASHLHPASRPLVCRDPRSSLRAVHAPDLAAARLWRALFGVDTCALRLLLLEIGILQLLSDVLTLLHHHQLRWNGGIAETHRPYGNTH